MDSVALFFAETSGKSKKRLKIGLGYEKTIVLIRWQERHEFPFPI